jgi:hypothetical protein
MNFVLFISGPLVFLSVLLYSIGFGILFFLIRWFAWARIEKRGFVYDDPDLLFSDIFKALGIGSLIGGAWRTCSLFLELCSEGVYGRDMICPIAAISLLGALYGAFLFGFVCSPLHTHFKRSAMS